MNGSSVFAPLLSRLQRAKAELPEILSIAAERATIRAVNVTSDATPPKAGTGRGAYIGTNTVTGELKQHWGTDSVTKPIKTAESYETRLKNDVNYAAYVNNGHRLDRHFVPGLVLNKESGLLEYNPDGKGGIVVGTKTKYVKGEFMVEKGVEEYKKALGEILEAKIMELFSK